MNCKNPYIVKTITHHPGITDGGFPVPCGQCLPCRIQRTAEWAMRLQHEFQYWPSGHFITLTYAPENRPWAEAYYDDVLVTVPTLCKSDIQKFFKRFRKHYAKEKKAQNKDQKIRYFCGAEYGQTNTSHPHYHAIIFADSSFQEMQSLVAKSWTLGLNHVGSCTNESINYTAGYIQKKWYGDPHLSPNYPALEPFALQSQKLGKQYVIDNEQQLIHNACVPYRGAKRKLPRYYRRFIHGGAIPEEWTLLWANQKNKSAAKNRKETKQHAINRMENISMHEKNKLRYQMAIDQYDYDLHTKINQNPKGGL